MNRKYTLYIVSFLLGLLLIPNRAIYSQTSSAVIDADVQISVCGNGSVEGGEDCEGTNLNGQSCTTLGFGGGSLSCDIACGFITNDCIEATPTPTPSEPTSAISNSEASIITETSTPEPITSQVPTQIPELRIIATLPGTLNFFDINNDGKLSITNLSIVVGMWVEEWKSFVTNDVSNSSNSSSLKLCDINVDNICDVRDFSILLSYIE